MELRHFTRAPFDHTLEFAAKGADSSERLPGVARDISVGGMFVETESPIAFGKSVVIYVRLPASKTELTLPGVVRWTRTDGMGVQFGLLGARETHAITEVVKARDEAGYAPPQ